MSFKKKVNVDTNKLSEDILSAICDGIDEICTIIEADAVLECPVDTGTLKDSITHEVENDDGNVTGTVGTNVEYAYWADRKKPYLSLAVDRNKANMDTIIRKHLKEVSK